MKFLLLASLLAAMLTAPAAAQIVPNGDCELGLAPANAAATTTATAVTDWFFYQGNVATLANWVIGKSADAYAGTGAGFLSLKADGKNGYYRTTVAGLVVGQPYQVSAYLKHTGYGFIQILARPKGGSTIGGGQHGSDVWSLEQLNVWVYPNAVGEIEIEIKEYTQAGTHPTYGDWSSGYFDDVSIYAVPEPSSLLGLLSGLPILALAIRRKR